jgi:hypothetical protein
MAAVEITVKGYNPATIREEDLEPERLAFLTEIAEKITAASETGCMPKMTIKPHVHDDECLGDHK